VKLRGADALGVGAAKLAVSLAVLAGGVRAVSDDDYARVVIAQRFAEMPRLDASGTSWLPLPFWLYGAALRLFGDTLTTARVVAVLLGVGATLLLLAAALRLGASRSGALTGALLAAAFPWSAWLGVATVPEVPAAALMVFGLATLAQDEPRERLLGALALAAACFCRYEAWPVAIAFASCTLIDAARKRAPTTAVASTKTLLPAGLALLPIALWLLHGVFVHGDAFFFWKRVASYRQALGGGAPLLDRLVSVPRSLVAEEPELWLGLVVVAAGLRSLTSYRQPRIGAITLLIFLMVGELAGGGPTHHAARAVLPIWYLLALMLGDLVGRRVDSTPARRLPWLGFASSLVAVGWLFRVSAPPGFPDRSAAVELGTRARELRAPELLIDTPDYAYLAVTAAFAAPSAADPFDDRDPRHPTAPDPFATEASLRARWANRPAAWLVVTREHAKLAARLGSVRAEAGGLSLLAPGATAHGAP